MPAETLHDLRPVLSQLNITTETQFAQLVGYCELVEKWNKHFNLVSRNDVHRLPRRHVLDSLSGVTLLGPGSVLDIGSGAGLPGMILAIALPQQPFVLLDRHARKVRFLQQTVTTLGLANVQVQAQDLSAEGTWVAEHRNTFGNVVSRAVTHLTGLCQLGLPLLGPHGRLVAYTATGTDNEELDRELASLQKIQQQMTLYRFDPSAQPILEAVDSLTPGAATLVQIQAGDLCAS